METTFISFAKSDFFALANLLILVKRLQNLQNLRQMLAVLATLNSLSAGCPQNRGSVPSSRARGPFGASSGIRSRCSSSSSGTSARLLRPSALQLGRSWLIPWFCGVERGLKGPTWHLRNEFMVIVFWGGVNGIPLPLLDDFRDCSLMWPPVLLKDVGVPHETSTCERSFNPSFSGFSTQEMWITRFFLITCLIGMSDAHM